MLQEIHDVVVQSVHRIANWNMTPDYSGVTVDFSRKANSGDVATNVAMVVGNQLSMDPKLLAPKIIKELERHYGEGSCVIAGPGFINITLDKKHWFDCLPAIMYLGTDFGNNDSGIGRTPINVEYVSANPTGPLHIGHARGAIFGDTLAALLAKCGFDVVREYYVNDAGGQIDALLDSVYYRYEQIYNKETTEPENFYPGEYIIEIAKKWDDFLFVGGKRTFTHHQKEVFVDNFRDFVLSSMMELVKDNLYSLGIEHDVFTHESNILASGGVDNVLRKLREGGHTYKGTLPPPKGQDAHVSDYKHLLFKSAQFGDDVDRPIKKQDGSWTYFATDVAYHMDKYERGHNGATSILNIWGADHGGYVKRVQAAMEALTGKADIVDVTLCQMVSLVDNGVAIKMSKRDNNFVTVDDVVDRVGKDALRFTMLTRKVDAQLVFDFQKAVEQSKDNMVYYVQYAHARGCSVLNKATEMPEYEDATQQVLDRLVDPAEIELIKKMASWPDAVTKATFTCEPHRIAFYLYELSSLFHALWTKGNKDGNLRFIIDGDEELTMARLILVQCVLSVLKSGLDVMGVSAPESM